MKQYYIYILTNRSGTLYVGVTNDLKRRVYRHKHGLIKGFTSKYGINRLVYYESTTDVRSAITREKEIKGWRRSKKIALIESFNRNWKDLAAGWFRITAMHPSDVDKSQDTRGKRRDSSLRSE